MATFPRLPKKKAYTVSNGVFLVILGFLFYTGQWWPGILFALGLTFAVRQYLTGRRFDLFLTVIMVGILSVITFTGNLLSTIFPLFLIAGGLFLIAKEFFLFKTDLEENRL